MGIRIGELTKWIRPRRLAGGRDSILSGYSIFALALLSGFVSLPILGLALWTLDENSWQAMTSTIALQALVVTIKTTLVSLIILLFVGTPAAYILARVDFLGKRVIDTLIDIPVVLPPVAAGIALLLALGRMGLLGQYLHFLGIELSFTMAGVVVAQTFVALPFYIRPVTSGFERIERDVEDAAMVDGADRVAVFTKITIPLVLPTLIGSAISAWARAVGEFGGTIIFAGSFLGVTQTLPVAIYEALERTLTPQWRLPCWHSASRSQLF